MNTSDLTSFLEQLNKAFAIQQENQRLVVEMGEGHIPVIMVYNDHASAIISLQGAHLLSWVPKGDGEVSGYRMKQHFYLASL